MWTDESISKQQKGDVHVKAYAVIVEDELLIRTVLATLSHHRAKTLSKRETSLKPLRCTDREKVDAVNRHRHARRPERS